MEFSQKMPFTWHQRLLPSVAVFETYDRPLIRKGKKVTKIVFREPPPRGQPNLPLAGGGSNAKPEHDQKTRLLEAKRPSSKRQKPDNKEQSRLFIEKAREIGADEDRSAADELSATRENAAQAP